MSTAISDVFVKAAEEGRAAFIPFVTGGFPDDEHCLRLIRELDQAGADLIEIGVPFSDPLADGPTIQTSSQIALEHGTTPPKVLELAARASAVVQAPLIIMTYYNPVLRMGPERFAEAAAKAGVSGLIIPDLPPEEAGPWLEAAERSGLDTIFMATPPTPIERLGTILEHCGGFLYYVPITGVTGSGLKVDQDMLAALSRVRQASNLPVAVGFGVSKPEHAAALAPNADGVIVGSALVKMMLDADGPDEGIAQASELAASLKAALNTRD